MTSRPTVAQNVLFGPHRARHLADMAQLEDAEFSEYGRDPVWAAWAYLVVALICGLFWGLGFYAMLAGWV